MIKYVIGHVHLEYNDSGYDLNGVDKLEKGVFLNKQEAINKAIEQTVVELCNLGAYDYQLPESVRYSYVWKQFGLDYQNLNLSKDRFSREEWEDIVRCLDFPLYKVLEIEEND